MPRRGLDRAAVVAAAATLADQIGLDRLTLTAVAERVGVAAPSLYKHVDGLPGLRRDLAVLALDELADQLRDATVGRSTHDALHSMAQRYRRYAIEHPGRYASIAPPAPGDDDHARAAAGLLAVVFAVLRGYDLDGDHAVHTVRALHAALHGFVTLETGGNFKMTQDIDVSFEHLVDMIATALAASRR